MYSIQFPSDIVFLDGLRRVSRKGQCIIFYYEKDVSQTVVLFDEAIAKESLEDIKKYLDRVKS